MGRREGEGAVEDVAMVPIKLLLQTLSQRRASPGTPPAGGEAWLGEELGEEGGLGMLYLDKSVL